MDVITKLVENIVQRIWYVHLVWAGENEAITKLVKSLVKKNCFLTRFSPASWFPSVLLNISWLEVSDSLDYIFNKFSDRINYPSIIWLDSSIFCLINWLNTSILISKCSNADCPARHIKGLNTLQLQVITIELLHLLHLPFGICTVEADYVNWNCRAAILSNYYLCCITFIAP